MNEAMQEFVRYAKLFDLKNPDIMRKFHHTFRVVEYAKDIARSEGLSDRDVILAMKCALLHDVARFRQFKMYNTYVDAKSFDHGDEGARILGTNKFVNRYTKDADEQKIIIKATRNHNKFQVEDGLTERELLFTNIVRDADKLDIMMEQGNTINGKFILNPLYLRPFQEKRLYKNKAVTGEYEVTMRTMAFIYDMNFKYSYEFIKENNIINDKVELLMSHSTSLGIFEYLAKICNEYVDERIEELSK
nr:HD domain-containing protein [Bacilli bacterium]